MLRFPVRVHADLSVYRGILDDEFASASRRFFRRVEKGAFRLVTSPLVAEELTEAPAEVQELAQLGA